MDARISSRILLMLAVGSVLTMAGAASTDLKPKAQEVFPGIWRIRMGTPEKFTPLAFRSAAPDRGGLNRMPKVSASPILPDSVSAHRSDRGCEIVLPLGKDDKIYGLGLNTANFELSGHRAWVVPSDHPEDDTNESHAPDPFYVSSAGYGVYVDTARYATFSVGIASTKDEPAKRTVVIDVPTAKGVDVYVFAGPSTLEAVQRYNLFAGGGSVPPLWGLGMAFRGKGDSSAEDVRKLAKSFRADDIPCDIFGIEPGWQTQTYSSSFVWNKPRFPDPDRFIGQMHDLGYRMSFWEHPFTHPSSPIHEALKPFAGNYLVWNGLVPDFATKGGRDVFVGRQKEVLFSKGVDSLKIDEVDSQPFHHDRWSFPDTSVFPSGLDGEQMHSMFGILAQQALLQPLTDKNLRTWGLVRNSHALSAPLPYTLYTDSYDHKCYIRGLAKTGFGGHMWTPEVRDASSVEDLIRRIQTVIFSQYAMVDCWYMKMPPWLQIDADKSNAGVVMPEAPETTRLVRDLFRLRMSLVPYLYSAFNEYHRDGKPPVRALILDFPADPETAHVDDQFMFGPSLMVAPMIAGQAQRSVYLPKGVWFDYFTGERLEGGRKIEVSKPLAQLPLYVKADAMIPLAEPVGHVGKDTTFRIRVKVYGDHPAPFTLFEDDGETNDYAKGAQNRIELSWGGSSGVVKRSGEFSGRRYEIVGWDRLR
ncbi:MAG: glycoside hydrolase family 31 protein [Fimbriimonas sp.]|nr:glycoside hydrolase family 31 protein [Fimbriimonas sp.]